MKHRIFINAFLFASTITTCSLFAQEGKTLETFTVTAQKSEEDIQKIPMSISAFTNYQIQDASIDTLEDISKYTPNLYFFNTGQQGLTAPSIRGISANVVTFSSPVSLYIDGVASMNSFGYDSGLLDIERIEILRGPQGTLYGKNSEAGVINIITKKPTNEAKAKIFTTIGTDGKREVGTNLSGAIIKDKLYISLAYKHDQKDGFIKKTSTKEYINDKENEYAKVQLLYTPTDKLELSLIASKSKNDNGAIDWAKAGQSLDNVNVASNLDGSSSPSTKTLAFKIKYAIDNTQKLTSITTKRVHKDKAVLDNDLSAMTLRHFFRDYKFDTLAQELRYEKNFENIEFITGLYLDKEKDNFYIKRITPMDPTGANSKPQVLKSHSVGIFTNAKYALNDTLTFSAGVRYDKEHKNIQVHASHIDIKNNWHNVSPKFSLEYNVNPNMLGYFSVAKGYRSGGFNPFATSEDKKSYDEENLISYEIGYKSRLFSGKLILNGAIYYMDIDDMQVQEMPTPGTVYIINAASAKSKGIELEAQALLNDNFTFFTSLGINKTTFENFHDLGMDYSDNYNPFAPKYNFNLALQYRDAKGYYARADLNGYGKTYFDAANKYSQKAYALFNTKIGYETKDYDLYLYINNLFDKEHHATNAYFNGSATIYKEGREIGVKAAYRF